MTKLVVYLGVFLAILTVIATVTLTYRYPIQVAVTTAYVSTFSYPTVIFITRTSATEITSTTTTITTLFKDEERTKVGGGETIGWIYGFGRLRAGDIVRFEISSVYKVLVCLDELPTSIIGWKAVEYYHDCAYSTITDEGNWEWAIKKDGYYGLVIGKQAGYLSTSFLIKLEVLRKQEHITSYFVTTTQTFTETTYQTTTTTITETITTTTIRGILG